MGRDLTDRTKAQVARRQNGGEPQMSQQIKDAIADRATWLDGYREQIERALPRHMNADRMARLTLTAIRKNVKLALCSPMSFAGSLMTAAALGLEPNVGGECYLVPYERKNSGRYDCELIVGYQGYSKLFYQSPGAGHLDAQAVYEADEFNWRYGTNAYLHHKPARGDRGEIVAYYALATLTSGATPFVVLSPDEVRDLRNGKEGPSGDIPDPQRWMERKTAVRQLVKLLPKSPQLAAAAQADERSGEELYRDRLAERQAEDDVIDVPPGDIHEGTDNTDPTPNGDNEQ